MLCFAAIVCADETSELKKNWEALKDRKLDLLPVPKKIKFYDSVELKKVNITGDPAQPYFQVICEELRLRFKEIGSDVTVTVSGQEQPGVFNVILSKERLSNENLQAYTLTPVKNGVVLKGRENNLYAAVTLRFLITKENGKTVCHLAEVFDYPDFPERQTGVFAPWMWRYVNKDPRKSFESTRSVIRWALHHKITAIRNFPIHPYYKDVQRLHLLSKNELTRVLGNDNHIKSLRLLSDYAAERGIKFGVLYTTFALGSPREKDVPGYKDMMYYPTHQEFISWARLDMHRKKAAIILDYMKRTGLKVQHLHSVDGGSCDDPEYWSKRDALTRKMFGDDRAAADAAVFKEYIKGHAENGIQFDAIVYPYSGYYVTNRGIRSRLGLPDDPHGRAAAARYVELNKAYAARLNKLLPGHATISVRESEPELMKAFYDVYPNRVIKVYWEAEDTGLRDIGTFIAQELRSVRSAYCKERKNDIWIEYIQGRMLNTPGLTLFAEYAWNSLFPGWTHIDRSRNPVNYDKKNVALAAERAASGFFGAKAGKYITPLCDDLFSFRLAVDPLRTVGSLRNQPKDLPALMERNHKQLLKAEKSFDEAIKIPEKDFKTGSYQEFIQLYLWIKAAKAYSIANLAALKIGHAAVTGNFDLCKKYYDAAGIELKKAVGGYNKVRADLGSKCDWVRKEDIAPTKWFHSSHAHFTGELFIPKFQKLPGVIKAAYDARKATFAKFNLPDWIKGFVKNKNARSFSIPFGSKEPVEHWLLIVEQNNPQRIREIRLCQNPPQLWITRTAKGLVITGKVRNPELYRQPAEKLAFDQWPKAENIEVIIRPANSRVGDFFQFVLDPNGNVCTLFAKKKDGVERIRPYDFGKLDYTAKREKDFWTFEFKIPFSLLGAAPSTGWRMVFGYNSCGNTWFSRSISEKGASDPKNQHNVYFIGKKAEPTHGISFQAKDIACVEKTHSSGSGTFVTFTAGINTFRPLYNPKFSVKIESVSGNTLFDEQILPAGRCIAAFYQTPSALACQLEKSFDAFYIVMKIEAEGIAPIVKKIPVGKVDTSVPGPVAGSRAYPAVYSGESKPLAFKKGELSFSVKPGVDAVDIRDTQNRLLAYSGNFANGLTNRNSMLFRYSRQYGVLYFNINTPDFKTRMVTAKYSLPKDKWTDLKYTWDMTTDPVTMTVAVNGKILSGKVRDWKGENSTPPKSLSPVDYAPVFGGLKTGELIFDAFFANIKY